jgi:hypothetical protein
VKLGAGRKPSGEEEPNGPRLRLDLSSGASAEATTRLATFALWALVVLGAVGGTLAFITRPSSAAAGPAVEAPAPTAAAEGFAELFVATWLSAGEGAEDTLRPFYPEAVDMRGMTAGSRYAARTVTVDVAEVEERYWSVTVAADVLVSGEGGVFQRAGTRFFQVAVAQGPPPARALVAPSLPAEVPAPVAVSSVRLDIDTLERPRPDDAMAVAVQRFAAAFLTGQGELVRYVAPGSALRAVRPAPFTAIEVTRLSSRDREGAPTPAMQVLAEVRGTDAGGRSQVLHYSLELSQREGRWEVSEMLPGPPLRSAGPSPGATTSSTAEPLRAPPSTTTSTRAPAARTGGVSTTTTLHTSTTNPERNR